MTLGLDRRRKLYEVGASAPIGPTLAPGRSRGSERDASGYEQSYGGGVTNEDVGQTAR